MKMNKKIMIGLAVLAAFMMLAVPLIIVQSGSDADNPIPADSITVDFTKVVDYGTYGTASNNGLGNSITVNYESSSKTFVLTGSLKAQDLADTTSTFYKLWTTNTEYAYGIVFEVTVPTEGDKIKIGTNGAESSATGTDKTFQSLLYVKASESDKLVAITYTPADSNESVVYRFDVSALYEASVQSGASTSYYYKLVDAVAAAQPQDSGNIATVTVLKDATTTGVLAFTKPGQYTFDIGTNTVTYGAGAYMFTVGGSSPPVYPIDTINTSAQLTIVGTGNVVGLNTTFRSYGTMIIGDATTGAGPNVTIFNTSPNYSIFKVEEGSYLTVNGGTFSLSSESGNAVTRIMQSYGTTLINGGTFNADVQLWKYGDSTTQYTSTITINNGTFEDVFIAGIDTQGVLAATDKITIKQGTFKGTISETIQGGTIEVSGGVFENLSCLPFIKADSSVTLGKNYTVAQDSTPTVLAGTTVIIPSEITLTVAGTLTNNGTIVNNGTIDIKNETANKAQLVQAGGSITSALSSGKGSIVNEAKWTTGATSYQNHALVIKGGVFEKQNVTAQNMADDHAFMTVTANGTNTVIVQNNTFTMARPNGIGVDNIGAGVVSFTENEFVSDENNKVESCIFVRGAISSTIIVSGNDITGIQKFADAKNKGYAALVFYKYDSNEAFSVGGLASSVANLTVKTDISSIGIKRGDATNSTVLDVKDDISIAYLAISDQIGNEVCARLNIADGKTLTVTGKLDNYGTIANSGTLNAVGEIYLNTKGSATTSVGGHFIISDSGKLTIGTVEWIGANGTVVLSEGASADIITNIAGGFTATLNGIATIPQGKTMVLATNDVLVANGQVNVDGTFTIVKKEAASTAGDGKYVASSSSTVTIAGTKWIAFDGIVQLSIAATATLSTNTLGGFDCVLDGTAAIVSGKTLVIGEKDALTVNGKLTNAGTINNAGVINVDGTLTTTGAFATVGSISVGSSGKIDGAGTISFGAAASSTKVINVANGGVLTVTLDGTDTAAGAKESKVVLTAIAAGEGGITVTKGSVIIDGVIATPDAEGKIAVPAGSTVYVSGTVDEGVTLEIPATSVVVIPQGATLEVAAGAKVTNNGEIDVKSAGSEVIYEKGSVVNGVVIEVTTKEDNSGVHTVVIIWLVSEDPTKLAISENYVEAFSGAKYSEVLSLISVTPLRSYVTFTGWYNMAMNEKITLNDTVLPYEHYITACFDAEKRVPVPDEDVTPVIPDNTSGSSNVNEFALPIAFILLVCAIFALGFVIIRKK